MMKQQLIQKNILLIAFLLSVGINSFAQNTDKINDKYLVILGTEYRYTQVTNSKNSPQEVIDNINSVIDKFDTDNIIYVYSIHKALYLTIKGPKSGLDSIGMIRDERLNIVNDNIITKEEVNAFANKGLIQFVQKSNTNDIVVVGFMADYYIKESLLGGEKLGYEMYFIPEAIFGKSDKKKTKIFRKLIKKGIKQISIKDIM